jgi:hypothetical protein
VRAGRLAELEVELLDGLEDLPRPAGAERLSRGLWKRKEKEKGRRRKKEGRGRADSQLQPARRMPFASTASKAEGE